MINCRLYRTFQSLSVNRTETVRPFIGTRNLLTLVNDALDNHEILFADRVDIANYR